jgi:hypothetical protein
MGRIDMNHKSPRFLLVIVLCLAVFSASAPIASAEGAKSGNVLRIQLPKNIQPEEVTIAVWAYSPKYRTLNHVFTKSEVYIYSCELPDWADEIDIDVCHRHYKMIRATLSVDDAVRKPFIPKLELLPLVLLELKLIDTSGRPVSGQKVLLRRWVKGRQLHKLFYDGPAYERIIDTATTDSSGVVRVSIAKTGPSTSFQLSCDKASENKPGWPPVSITVDLQKKHTSSRRIKWLLW